MLIARAHSLGYAYSGVVWAENETPFSSLNSGTFGLGILESSGWDNQVVQQLQGLWVHRPGKRALFVHYSGIVGDGYRTLKEGDRVSFELVQGSKGPQAENVVKVDSIK
jgi:CspA family cold shock protein